MVPSGDYLGQDDKKQDGSTCADEPPPPNLKKGMSF